MTNEKFDIDVMIAEQKLSALEAGGVDNWINYYDSLDQYREMCEIDEEEELDDVDTLNALEIGGVDNWDWYDEALDGFYEYEEAMRELHKQGGTEFPSFFDWSPDDDESEVEVEESVPVESVPDTEMKVIEVKFPELLSAIADKFPELTKRQQIEKYDEIIKNVYKAPVTHPEMVEELKACIDLSTLTINAYKKLLTEGIIERMLNYDEIFEQFV